MVCCRDVRSPDTPVYSFTAHERGVSSISFNPLVPGMLATCSEDKTVRVWDVDAEVPLQVRRACRGGGVDGSDYTELRYLIPLRLLPSWLI